MSCLQLHTVYTIHKGDTIMDICAVYIDRIIMNESRFNKSDCDLSLNANLLKTTVEVGAARNLAFLFGA